MNECIKEINYMLTKTNTIKEIFIQSNMFSTENLPQVFNKLLHHFDYVI